MAELDFETIPIVELLRVSETGNSTPASGYEAAQVAFRRADDWSIEKGVAARQAAFRAEQMDLARSVVRGWFNLSRINLNLGNASYQRELAATYLLEGRVGALRLVRTGPGTSFPDDARRAREAFSSSEDILERQHHPFSRWDRYGTMLMRHWATHEAINGNGFLAATLAVRGIWRALFAQREGDREEHRAFVHKQVRVNALAGKLAFSGLLSFRPDVVTWRYQTAREMLG